MRRIKGDKPLFGMGMDLVEPILAASDGVTASTAFHKAVAPAGVTYLQTRSYVRPPAPLTPATHWQAGGFVSRIARDGWDSCDEFRYICLDCNPLVDAIRQGLTSYRFSDFAPRAAREYGAYWEAFGRADIADAICATSYGTGRRIASLHLGFGETGLDPAWLRAVRMAGLVLTERLIELADAAEPAQAAPQAATLTPRERDALSFVALGKTDWEIAQILGVSQATARFHVDNARRKLDAVNRAQAVARFLARDGIA